MKLKILLIAVCLTSLMSATFSAKAEMHCLTIPVDCGDGTGTNAIACGSTFDEIVEIALIIADETCN